MLTLPPLPRFVPALTDEEAKRMLAKQTILGDTDIWCPTCEGKKSFQWWDSAKKVAEYECPCPDQFRMWRYFGYFGPGDLYGRMSWDDTWGVTPATKTFVQEYLAELDEHAKQGNGLFLHGLNGNGKTLLASLVFRQYLAHGYGGFWATWNEMLDLYTTGWRDNEERAWFDRTVRSAQVLVIDDLGKESIGRAGVAMPALDSMFRARVQAGQITIMTTNESQESFRKRYSKAIVSLTDEACIEHHCVGEDMRVEYAEFKSVERKLRLVRPLTFG